jgi:hypothetical protein
VGSFEAIDDTKECLWMLKLNDSIAEDSSLIHLEIEEQNLNVSCYSNAIYVFNQILDTSQSIMQKKILSVVCHTSNYPKVIQSKTGQMSIYSTAATDKKVSNPRSSSTAASSRLASIPSSAMPKINAFARR